ncbi:S-adenosyl-L-methionine-dependent methyltransferase [Boletus edulis BED1]|uniref:S-adenosyl-L-methionine-dependent methyltransferase n=1 Tax=Boletus edulis BED1 TaxID=1328754 RepID=A0AAD4BY56_BOLED|nr:S-adenosyl-L-methionine-dependent methyltransferase [Boletus edulis BED1]
MNFYFEACQILDRLDARQGSIKSLLSTLPAKNRARTAALVIETLKYKAVLSDVIAASKLLTEEKKITSLNLALVLVHDVLLAGGIQAGDGPIKQAVLRHKTRLRSELQRIKVKRGVKSDKELANPGDERAARIPRYVRVNTLLWTTEEAIAHYQKRGFRISDPFSSEESFTRDQHVPDLLLFNPHMQFHNDIQYKTGRIILQDKASCFPAIILNPPCSEHAVVIDATAAPGNKTSHLSALMGGKGKLYAFERDRKRFSTLKTMLAKASCKNVETINIDFLNVDPSDPKYANATHILLDPSCSGSGIVNRLDHLLESENEEHEEQEERLNKLATFQLNVIRHAMKFPRVRRVVYSTCSIHSIENEGVVCKALRSEEAGRSNFKLAPPEEVLPSWHRRGLLDESELPENALSSVRCSPNEDATNGFFVSCFVSDRTQAAHSGDDITTKKRKRDGQSSRKKRKTSRVTYDR